MRATIDKATRAAKRASARPNPLPNRADASLKTGHKGKASVKWNKDGVTIGPKGPPGPAVEAAIIKPVDPGILRPYVYANQRLAVWLPETEAQVDDEVSSAEMRINFKRTFLGTWQEETLAGMGSSLQKYHQICTTLEISERGRAPVRNDVFLQVAIWFVGKESRSALKNLVAAVKGWHLINQLPWTVDDTPLSKLYKVAHLKAPIKKEPRTAITSETLAKIFAHLSTDSPSDIAVRACAAVMFWSVARSGELTVPNRSNYDLSKMARAKHLRGDVDRFGNEVKVIALPWTKVALVDGEDIMFAEQPGPIDPFAALKLHLDTNAPGEDEHLFAHTNADGVRSSLFKNFFIRRLGEAAALANVEPPKGHSFRIGGTLEYLLRGISLEVVKAIGRWSSDAFKLYLREHARVLAPYLQDVTKLDKSVADIYVSVSR